MTPTDLRTRIERSGLTQNDWCRRHGLAPRTVRRWISGSTAVPDWLPRYLASYRRSAAQTPSNGQ